LGAAAEVPRFLQRSDQQRQSRPEP